MTLTDQDGGRAAWVVRIFRERHSPENPVQGQSPVTAVILGMKPNRELAAIQIA